jgi:hypothetical protein
MNVGRLDGGGLDEEAEDGDAGGAAGRQALVTPRMLLPVLGYHHRAQS